MNKSATNARFQDFSNDGKKINVSERLSALRAELATHQIDAFMVPRADEHQGEYVPACSERLAYISGFTGSAGFCVITLDAAALFIDGRYTVQAREQVDGELFEKCDLIDHPPSRWMSDNLLPNSTLGFDPKLHSISEIKKLTAQLGKKGIALKSIPENPIDSIWQNRPPMPLAKVTIQELDHAGMLAKHKLSDLQKEIENEGADHYLINDTTAIAWAFNIRGNDLPHTPVALSYAMLSADGNHKIFIHPEKLTIETRAYLTQICDIVSPDEMENTIISQAKAGKYFIAPQNILSHYFADMILQNGGKMQESADLISLPRARKNKTEIEGAKAAHLRDGVAMAKFLHWLDSQEAGTIDEITAATALENFRVETGEQFGMPLLEISFDTISASGAHAALPHYRVNQGSNRILQNEEIFLIDSGGQYQDGTTDITRTVIIGDARDEMKQNYTLVLKGHIAIDQLRFPKGTTGAQIDIFARHSLWQNGLDFAHGTGHGVGSYLSVHEGPQGIAKRYMTAFEAGMIVSNEPGYYLENHYGIRIENLILVKAPSPIDGGNIEMMGFETLSYTPIDKRLINKFLLDEDEVDWLNQYHQETYKRISPHLTGDALEWLKWATAEL